MKFQKKRGRCYSSKLSITHIVYKFIMCLIRVEGVKNFAVGQHRVIFANNQLDAQFLSRACLFLFSTCFGQPRDHHQEN